MKNYLILTVLIATFGCNSTTKEEPNLSGAYNMLSLTTTEQDGTVVNREGVQQLKIFTKQYLMYVDFNRLDSTASFGIGTYTPGPGIITENIIYSASDSIVNTLGGEFDLDIEMNPNGYQQVITSTNTEGQKTKSTESYEFVGTTATSPLDGAWREIKSYYIDKGDTSMFPMTQYKTYYAGHFMYGQNYEDATGRVHTGMGFGTYEMVSDTLVKEVVTVSTTGNSGRTFIIEIEFNGPDEYKQTITDENGVLNVEIYRRLEKLPE